MKFRFEISLRNLIEQYNPLRDDNNLQVKTKKEVSILFRFKKPTRTISPEIEPGRIVPRNRLDHSALSVSLNLIFLFNELFITLCHL